MSRKDALSQAEFERALGRMERPGGRIVEFLSAHLHAPGRASTATQLAEAVGYPNNDPINLHYGSLAGRIGRAAGRKCQGVNLNLLVTFIKPTPNTNEQWVLVMRPEFAAALEKSGWLQGSRPSRPSKAPQRTPDKATLASVTPLIPSGGSLPDAVAFYTDQMGFFVVWQSAGMAGIKRDGIAFNLVENDSRAWAENATFSIGVSDLEALYEEYRQIPAKVGPLELKSWGRREFHMIVPSGVCFQFYEREVV